MSFYNDNNKMYDVLFYGKRKKLNTCKLILIELLKKQKIEIKLYKL